MPAYNAPSGPDPTFLIRMLMYSISMILFFLVFFLAISFLLQSLDLAPKGSNPVESIHSFITQPFIRVSSQKSSTHISSGNHLNNTLSTNSTLNSTLTTSAISTSIKQDSRATNAVSSPTFFSTTYNYTKNSIISTSITIIDFIQLVWHTIQENLLLFSIVVSSSILLVLLLFVIFFRQVIHAYYVFHIKKLEYKIAHLTDVIIDHQRSYNGNTLTKGIYQLKLNRLETQLRVAKAEHTKYKILLHKTSVAQSKKVSI